MLTLLPRLLVRLSSSLSFLHRARRLSSRGGIESRRGSRGKRVMSATAQRSERSCSRTSQCGTHPRDALEACSSSAVEAGDLSSSTLELPSLDVEVVVTRPLTPPHSYSLSFTSLTPPPSPQPPSPPASPPNTPPLLLPMRPLLLPLASFLPVKAVGRRVRQD